MTNHAKVGGILSIVAGGLGVLNVLGLIFLAALTFSFSQSYSGDYYYNDMNWDGTGIVIAVFVVIGLAMLVLGALAIVGGIFALRKKVWGLALAGSIASALIFLPCGVVAIIFTAMAKPEFNAVTPPAPAATHS